jgi:hypothetical protein
MKPKDYECNGIDEIQAAGELRTKHLSQYSVYDEFK